MKILHICNHFYPCIGGIEKYVEDICINLKNYGFISDVACLNTCAYNKNKLPYFEKYKGIKIFRLPYINLKYYKIAPFILKFIKSYDILHVHGLGFFSDFLLSTKFFHKKPVIISVHGGIFHTKNLLLVKKLYFNLWCRFILKFSDIVIAESKSTYRIFSKISIPILLPCAIYYNKFYTCKKKKENCFLFVGRISKNKRIDNLIKTFYFLKKYEKNIKLYIVGGDWEGIKKELENLVYKLKLEKNIIFVGEKKEKELLKYYKNAKFFVSASEYEGFGISVIESMAAGCIPIVNNIEAFKQFIKNGENGFILNFSDYKQAAKKIYEILKYPNLEKIRKNAQKTAKKYDWSNVIKQLVKIYEKILKK